MSGGHYDYNQYRLKNIVDQIDEDFTRLGKEDEYGYVFELEPEVIEVMKQVKIELETLYQKVHDLDWVISGDSGVEILEKYLKNDN